MNFSSNMTNFTNNNTTNNTIITNITKIVSDTDKSKYEFNNYAYYRYNYFTMIAF